MEGLFRRALVIAPLRVCYRVWPKEARKWTDFHDLKVEVLHGPHKEAALRRDADAYVINPEGLTWLLAEGRFQLLAPDTLVVDESSKFKNPQTQRFKQLKPLLPTFKRRWILTGSPSPNGYLDLFGQLYICDLGRSLGPYITHYRANYFFPTGFGGYTWKLKPGSDVAIQERIKPVCLRLAAEDYIDMPEVIENTIRVDLPPSARKVYDDLEDDMFTELEGKAITAVNSAAASVKCRQVASGGLYHPTLLGVKRTWTNLHNAKVDALRELVDELSGSPLLVAYDFEHDLDRLRREFGADVPVLGGGTSPKRTGEIEDAWNAGDLPLLLAHPAAMGHGLNLQQSGHHVCWHSLTWDYELYDQFIRRVRREGQQHAAVYVHHIVARDTTDDAIMRALRSKRSGQNALLTALRQYRATRKKNCK